MTHPWTGACPTPAGGYGGAYDLSGNAYEWEDSCTGWTGDTDNCFIRGGAGLSSATSQAVCVFFDFIPSIDLRPISDICWQVTLENWSLKLCKRR